MSKVYFKLEGNKRVDINSIEWIDETTNEIELSNGKKKTISEADMIKLCANINKRHRFILPAAVLLIIIGSIGIGYIIPDEPEPLAYEVQQCLAQLQED
jgi:hypothetical protein